MPAWSCPSSSSRSDRIIPWRDFAAELAALDNEPSGQRRAWERDRDRRARAEVPGAAHDLVRLGLAHVHRAELQPVGVRVLPGLEHLPDAEEAEVPAFVRDAEPFDRGDDRRGHVEPRRKLLHRHLERDVVAKP